MALTTRRTAVSSAIYRCYVRNGLHWPTNRSHLYPALDYFPTFKSHPSPRSQRLGHLPVIATLIKVPLAEAGISADQKPTEVRRHGDRDVSSLIITVMVLGNVD